MAELVESQRLRLLEIMRLCRLALDQGHDPTNVFGHVMHTARQALADENTALYVRLLTEGQAEATRLRARQLPLLDCDLK